MMRSTNYLIASALLAATWAGVPQETPEQMMFADFARESFKHPGFRRDGADIGHPGYKNFLVSELKVTDGLRPNVYALWTNESRKEIIFSLRGTPLSQNLRSVDDWDDVEIQKNKFTHGRRAMPALRTLRAIQAQFTGYTISMTGHSLGATTALLLLAQDRHNNIICHETNPPRSAISVVYVYNPFHFKSIAQTMEPFYGLAFKDPRCHAVFIFGDMFSAGTKKVAEDVQMPEDRMSVFYLSGMWRYPPLSYKYAHNIDGTKGALQLTSPGYVLGDVDSKN